MSEKTTKFEEVKSDIAEDEGKRQQRLDAEKLADETWGLLGGELFEAEKIPKEERPKFPPPLSDEEFFELELKVAEGDVHELEVPIKKIIQKIKKRINGSEYGLIIGDDASGRIPALILGGFIKKVAKDKGQKPPETVFIPGKIDLPVIANFFEINLLEESEEYFKKHGATTDRRILIVTDTVQSGNSLKTLVRFIKRFGYVCDVATIGLEKPNDEEVSEERKRNFGNTEIISGEYIKQGRYSDVWPHTPRIYERYNLSGVYKTEEGLKSRLRKNEETIEKKRLDIQKTIGVARKAVKLMVDELFE